MSLSILGEMNDWDFRDGVVVEQGIKGGKIPATLFGRNKVSYGQIWEVTKGGVRGGLKTYNGGNPKGIPNV